MSEALAIYSRFDKIQEAGRALAASGYFTQVGQDQAIARVMAGAELGIPPFAAMSGIHIIQGKPTLSANLIATLVDKHPRYDFRVLEQTEGVCRIEWRRDGETVGESGFTMEEAKRAGLTGKDGWRKYPSDMLFARALTRGCRRFAPGIFGGAPAYTPEELGQDVDEDGHIVEGEVVEVLPEEPSPEPAPPPRDRPAPKSWTEKLYTNGADSGLTPGQVDAVCIAKMGKPASELTKDECLSFSSVLHDYREELLREEEQEAEAKERDENDPGYEDVAPEGRG